MEKDLVDPVRKPSTIEHEVAAVVAVIDELVSATGEQEKEWAHRLLDGLRKIALEVSG